MDGFGVNFFVGFVFFGDEYGCSGLCDVFDYFVDSGYG